MTTAFMKFMGMEDRVGERRFVNERTLDIDINLDTGVTSSAALELFQLGTAFGANALGLKGEKVDYATTVMHDGKVSIRLITRTRTQRFLAWITRSF